MWDWMSLKMDNRDVAGNSPLLLSCSRLRPPSFASPLRPLTESAPTRRSSPSASGRPEATGSAPPPPDEVSDPVAAPHPGPGLLSALGFRKGRHRVCLASAFRKINHLQGSSELRSLKQRQPWAVLRFSSQQLPLGLCAAFWKSCFSELLSDMPWIHKFPSLSRLHLTTSLALPSLPALATPEWIHSPNHSANTVCQALCWSLGGGRGGGGQW